MIYIEYFPPKIKNNERRSDFIAFIQYCSIYPTYCNKKGKIGQEYYRGWSKTVNICGHHDYLCTKPYRIYK